MRRHGSRLGKAGEVISHNNENQKILLKHYLSGEKGLGGEGEGDSAQLRRRKSDAKNRNVKRKSPTRPKRETKQVIKALPA